MSLSAASTPPERAEEIRTSIAGADLAVLDHGWRRLLSELGVAFEHPEARALLAAAGPDAQGLDTLTDRFRDDGATVVWKIWPRASSSSRSWDARGTCARD